MFRFARVCVCLAAGLAVLGTGCTGDPQPDPTGSQSQSPPATQTTRPSATPTSTSAGPTPGPEEQALLAKARAEGHVKVLVRLKLPQTPAKLDARKAVIANAQDRFEAELEPLGAEVDQRFKFTPLVAMEVDEAVLQFLFESPLVDRVHEDQVRRPES